jgi:hypothetical protein
MLKKLRGVTPFTHVLSPRACQQVYAHARHPEVD